MKHVIEIRTPTGWMFRCSASPAEYHETVKALRVMDGQGQRYRLVRIQRVSITEVLEEDRPNGYHQD